MRKHVVYKDRHLWYVARTTGIVVGVFHKHNNAIYRAVRFAAYDEPCTNSRYDTFYMCINCGFYAHEGG